MADAVDKAEKQVHVVDVVIFIGFLLVSTSIGELVI